MVEASIHHKILLEFTDHLPSEYKEVRPDNSASVGSGDGSEKLVRYPQRRTQQSSYLPIQAYSSLMSSGVVPRMHATTSFLPAH